MSNNVNKMDISGVQHNLIPNNRTPFSCDMWALYHPMILKKNMHIINININPWSVLQIWTSPVFTQNCIVAKNYEIILLEGVMVKIMFIGLMCNSLR